MELLFVCNAYSSSLAAVNKDSLLQRLLLLTALLDILTGALCVSTKDQLGLEFPLLRNLPVSLCTLIDDGVCWRILVRLVILFHFFGYAYCSAEGWQHSLRPPGQSTCGIGTWLERDGMSVVFVHV
jgi:hypothetical protein